MKRRSIGLGALVLLALAAPAPSASAKPVVIGSPLEGEFRGGQVRGAGTYFNTTFAEPQAIRSSPVDGAIIRFSILGGSGGPYRLRVLRPAGGGAYRAVASTAALTFDGGPEPHFRAVRIQKGDTVGLDLPAEGKIAALRTPESAYAAWAPPLPGDTPLAPTGSFSGIELGFNAVVLPQPTVSIVAPLSLPFDKGGEVRIHGKDFRRVKQVTFGRTSVRYRVVSESLILAFPRPRPHPQETQVRVLTEAGKSVAGPGSSIEFRPSRG
ncbi:MAG TPA: hypothetical protein VFU16_01180 [Solirubrobacterales bacterium]|nr:hypothetical protein [Solirubrobacterales bacterium]